MNNGNNMMGYPENPNSTNNDMNSMTNMNNMDNNMNVMNNTNNINGMNPMPTNNMNQGIQQAQTMPNQNIMPNNSVNASQQNLNSYGPMANLYNKSPEFPQPNANAVMYNNPNPNIAVPTMKNGKPKRNFAKTCLYTFFSILVFTIFLEFIIGPNVEDILQKCFEIKDINPLDSQEIINFIKNSKTYQLLDSALVIILPICVILISILDNLKNSLISIAETTKYFIFIAICTLLLNFGLFTLTGDAISEHIDTLTETKDQYEILGYDDVVDEMTGLISLCNIAKYVYIISPIITLVIAYPTIKKVVTKNNTITNTNNIPSNNSNINVYPNQVS